MTEKETKKIILKFERNKVIPDEVISIVSAKTIKAETWGRKLNKKNNAVILTQTEKNKILTKARSSGYFSLNSFAFLYRNSIKISHPTLWRRIYKDKNILKTLIDKGIIELSQKVKEVNLKNINEENIRYVKVKVFYDKRLEFIKFIKNYFLTEGQKKEKL